MSDDALRELERAYAASGSVPDHAALLRARLRAGLEAPSRLRLLAYLGEEAPRLALDRPPEPAALDPSPEVGAALDEYESLYGVVEHCLFDGDGLEGPAGHELVARETARIFADEAVPDALLRDPAATVGERQRLEAFLGVRFDRAARRLLFPSADGLLPPLEAAAVRARTGGYGSSDFDGYARAFSAPPYGLGSDLVRIERLFLAIWEGLIGSFDPDAVEVYAWTTDAWPWFDAGREWWGSFLWSVRPPGGRPWVGIAASTTD